MIAYHGIDDPARFAEHLDYVRRSSFPVTLGDVVDAVRGRRGLPKRAVLITLDDGDPSWVEVAMPMLKDRGLPGVAFVVAGVLDTEAAYWWEEVEDLVLAGGTAGRYAGMDATGVVRALKRVPNGIRIQIIEQLKRTAATSSIARRRLRRKDLPYLRSAGIDIGNHSLTHPCVSLCSISEMSQDLGASHDILTDATGVEPIAFAYPDGRWDARAESIIAEMGYEVAFLFDHWLSHSPPRHPLRISRLRVGASTSLERFRTIVSGLHPTLHAIRLRVSPALRHDRP